MGAKRADCPTFAVDHDSKNQLQSRGSCLEFNQNWEVNFAGLLNAVKRIRTAGHLKAANYNPGLFNRFRMLATSCGLKRMTTATKETPVDAILHATAELRSQLLAHPIYDAIHTREQLKVFMRYHAFAVYDFMWLLKRLQQDICGVRVPWLPSAEPEIARFINEIVLGEETDEDAQGSFCSHFELYLEAMQDVDASTISIQQFVENLRSGMSVEQGLAQANAPEEAMQFVTLTHRLTTGGSTAEVAAAFCFGREDIIPDMFQRLLQGFDRNHVSVPRLRYYIQRHIELDGDHHGPLARQLVNSLCGINQSAMEAAVQAACMAIRHRIALWDGVLSELGKTNC